LSSRSRNVKRSKLAAPDRVSSRGRGRPADRLRRARLAGGPATDHRSDGGRVGGRRLVPRDLRRLVPVSSRPPSNRAMERMAPSPRVGLGRPVKRPLQFSDSILLGGPSHDRHSPALPRLERTDEAAALPIAPGSVVHEAQAVLRPPPTPSRHPPTSRLLTAYRTRRSGASPQPPGRGGPPQFPPPPSERSTPPTPGSSSGPRSRLFTPSMAFALRDWARLFLSPARRRATLTARQASLNAADRSVAPRNGALDAALRPRAFPPEAGSLLPGLQAAPRTGLPPAGDDELLSDQVIPTTTSNDWAHSRRSGEGAGAAPARWG
jgi:hypothetical protein